MRAQKVFTTIDTHTGGNPTRILISGLPTLIGETMSEKMLYMSKEYDWIRKLLMNEPRGHDVMSGVLLTEPCHEEADIGVIYIETGGYLPMCGHDTIGVCTALVEAGLIQIKEPITSLTLDTPAGLVEVEVLIEDGKAVEVSFCNVPSFLLKNISVYVKGIGQVEADIAYGGNFYAIVDAKSVGLELIRENASRIIDTAIEIRKAINDEVDIVHPQYPFIQGLTHVEFFTDPVDERAGVKNTVVVPPGGIDRSPCGTGTSAKLAVLHAKKELGIGEEFVHESIVGSLFRGCVLEATKVGNIDAVVTKITGSAWLMGMHRFFYHDEDPLKEGFLLIPPMESIEGDSK